MSTTDASGDSPTADRTSTLRDPPSTLARVMVDAEHRANVLRLRFVCGFVTVVWFASVYADVGAARALAPDSLPALLALRAGGGLFIALMWARLRFGPRPSPAMLRILRFAVLVETSGVMYAMGAVCGGVPSPYFAGGLLAMVALGTLTSDHWKRGLIDASGAALAYPVSIFVAGRLSPFVAAQLEDPVDRFVLRSNIGNLLLACVFVVVSGHISWQLRRQVFETRSLGRYKLKKRIGSGGMGEVWSAHHVALNRDVAVKILAGDGLRRDPNAVARFEREVRATTEFTHPNTVRVFDYGVTDDGVWYYAMELLEGEDIASLVAREGALPSPRAVHLVSQAARALAEAHERGIVHRDVKPENLFVARVPGEVDFVKVLDFGIAKIASAERDAHLTDPGLLVGTPAWLAPESIRGAPIDARADVYALGAVLYFALAGRPPFEGDGPSLVRAHMYERPQLPSAKRGSPLPDDVQAVAMRCLEKQPDARYPTAREVALALAACDDAGRWSSPGIDPPPRQGGGSSVGMGTADTLVQRR